MPTCQMSSELKSQIAQLKRMYKKIDNDFLENRIVPRLIVIVSETQHKKPQPRWQPKQYSNVTININRYLAQYNYDIAQLINP